MMMKVDIQMVHSCIDKILMITQTSVLNLVWTIFAIDLLGLRYSVNLYYFKLKNNDKSLHSENNLVFNE